MASEELTEGAEPLTRRTRDGRPYRRHPSVDAQIIEATRLSTPQLLARAKEQDKTKPGFLKEECVVYFIRQAAFAQDSETVNSLTEALLRRCASWTVRRFRAFGLERTDAEEAYQDLVADMIDSIIDPTNDDGEFFQIRFWRALRYRLIKSFDKRTRRARRGLTHDSLSEAAGGSKSLSDHGTELDDNVSLEEVIGSGEDVARDVEVRILSEEALRAIRDKRHREAFVLRHFEGWQLETQEPDHPSLSDYFGVTDRTIRNWLRTAQADLDLWRATHPPDEALNGDGKNGD
jgi:DNA-directed RNA polymerase specialized sigma24 family protein